MFEHSGETSVCGYRFSGELVETLKGADRTAEFFILGVDVSPPREGAKYLVFARKQNPEDTRRTFPDTGDSWTTLQRARFECVLDGGNNVLTPEKLIPFEDAARETFGGEWLRNQVGGLLAYVLSRESGGNFRIVTLEQGPSKTYVVKWDEVRKTISEFVEEGLSRCPTRS